MRKITIEELILAEGRAPGGFIRIGNVRKQWSSDIRLKSGTYNITEPIRLPGLTMVRGDYAVTRAEVDSVAEYHWRRVREGRGG